MINPISFRPGPVTFWTTLVYLAFLIPLVIINETPPPLATGDNYEPVNMTEAWLDLTTLTRAYHPVNSQNNDVIRSWLIGRIATILDRNGALWSTETLGSSASGCVCPLYMDGPERLNPLLTGAVPGRH